jgi:Meiotically up-regulated gene 113
MNRTLFPLGDNMLYDPLWEEECIRQMQKWPFDRYFWEKMEQEMDLSPDDRLDEVGWETFYAATSRGMEPWDAAALAMDGTLRQRRRVRDQLLRSLGQERLRRFKELHPKPVSPAFTSGFDELEHWRDRLEKETFVYFIQAGDHGPVKIGFSNKPDRRLPQLQTGNHRDLQLRHVIPGDKDTERELHERFADARIRGEWFGLAYLPLILTFAAGLAHQMVTSYDDSGRPPVLDGAHIRTPAEIHRLRKEIERILRDGAGIREAAAWTNCSEREIYRHIAEMSKSSFWHIHPHYIALAEGEPAWYGEPYVRDPLPSRRSLSGV